MAGSRTYSVKLLLQVINQATAPLTRIGTKITRMNMKVKALTKSVTALGVRMKTVGRSMMTALSLPLALFGGLALNTAVKFQTSMNKVGAITGATGEEFKKLEAQAKQLGATTQFSASQSAEAMTFLGMAGLNTKEIMTALPQTLQLAAAGGLDLATAADIATNIMTSMGKKASDLTKINDILAKAQSRSNTNIEQLAEAFRPVAPIADTLGVSVSQLTAMLGKMADAGERGSIAGTLLRNALLVIANPSAKARKIFQALNIDVSKFVTKSGKLKDIPLLLKQLKDSGATASQIMQAFGERGGRAIALLLKEGKDIGKFTKELENSEGTAAKMQKRMMQGLPGAMKRLKSAFEAFQLSLTSGKTGETLAKIIDGLAGLFTWFSKLSPSVRKFIVILGVVIATLGPILFVIGKVIAMAGPIMTAVGALKVLALAFWGVAKALVGLIIAGGPVIWIITAIAIAALLLWKFWKPIKKFFMEAPTWLFFIMGPLGWLLFGIRLIIKNFGALKDAAVTAFDWIVAKVLWLGQKLGIAWNFFKRILGFGGSGGTAQKLNSAQGGLGGNTNKSEVTVRVQAQGGASATVGGIRNTSGKSKVRVNNGGMGATFATP